MSIVVYTVGLVHASVCAPKDVPIDDVLAHANHTHPTGVTPWQLSDEKFKGGEPNPCPCNSKPDTHLHYLLVC